MKQYKLINNLTGWVVFIVAATVYCLTIEPTASFWDCPEFITTGYKLEVGHPPGAPFFMLMANLFTRFAFDVSAVAKMVNYMSALMSGACILFLFWSITHLVRKLVVADERNISLGAIITIMGSGVIGALVYTFSDTFWFSAVEGEVYAFSSLFTAVVFWLILKWEDVADQPHSDRWLILIAYLTGLSIGVHLLNLLCLPAIVLVYYYKRSAHATVKGSILALIVSAIMVAAVLYGIVPGIVKVGGWFELLFVNGMGMPFNTGVVIYIVIMAIVLIWGVYESYVDKHKQRMVTSFILTITLLGIPFYGHGTRSVVIGILIIAILWVYLMPKTQGLLKENRRVSARVLNTALLCVMMIVIGYSSYALIVIRSTANTPMDQNSPEDIFTLGEYLGREQYGTRPLFYGPAFSSQIALDVKDGYCVPRQVKTVSKYIRKEKESENEKDSYLKLPGRIEYEYAQNMLFPRMYNSASASAYKQWVNIKGYDVPFDQCGETVMVNMPTQWENIQFFFIYQLNFMYWRYFMWNFVGRQNDIQGSGEIEHGNWITGIGFIDNLLVGNQRYLPTDLRNNKGRNVYYCLPLLLGLIGLFWQAYRDQRGIQQFWIVFFLFFMTGIAIVFYLNQTPGQPRERDYAYAASFYAFAIWVGMGVAGVTRLLRRYLKSGDLPAAIVATVLCLFVPIQMACQNWDDHDRSNRYVARDFGRNYLMTLQETGNPIIYTNGDNDSFPLWYNQEVENFRTDARVCNLSYLQTDWYIDQMKRPSYDSPSLPITWSRLEYVEGQNDYVVIRPDIKTSINEMYAKAETALQNGNPAMMEELKEQFGENPYELKNILRYWIRSDREGLRVVPTDSIVMRIDKDAVLRSGMSIPPALHDSIPEYMVILLRENGKPKRALYKNEMMMLEMLAYANWERPIYMAITVGTENYLGMGNHFVQEGLAYRFTPFDTEALDSKIDSEKMYDNLMNKFKFGGIDKEGIYIDENTMHMCNTHRRIFTHLIEQLLKENKNEQALSALDYVEKMVPAYNVPYEWQNGSYQLADYYYQLGEKEKAERIIDELANRSVEYMIWYLSMNDGQFYISGDNFVYYAGVLNAGVQLMEQYESEEMASHYSIELTDLYDEYLLRMKGLESL